MKRYLLSLKIAIFCILLVSSSFIIFYFFYYNQHFEWYSIDVKVNWMITILYFILFFYLLIFLIDFNLYIKFFNIIVPIGTFLWIGIYFLEFFKVELGVWNWTTIRHLSAILCLAILSPGLNLYIIKYIKNNSNPNRKRKVIKNYHIHEGFVGIIFVILSLILWLIRLLMIQHEILKKRLRILLAVDMILLFLFLFSGSFLILRDRRDVARLKFIEKQRNHPIFKISPIFNLLSPESIHFFKFPRGLYYPFGIILNSFALNMFIHGTDFLPTELFQMNHETIVLIGFFLCFFAGGMIGIDWYRLFAKLYPNLYQDLEQILVELRKQKNY